MDLSVQELMTSLKAARKKRGLSQKALGMKVGLPQSHISKIEQGLVDLQASSLIQIARALELEPVLVHRSHLSAVQALESLSQKTGKFIPAYRLSDEKEQDDDAKY